MAADEPDLHLLFLVLVELRCDRERAPRNFGLGDAKVAAEFGVHPKMLALMQIFNNSTMSVYRVERQTDATVHLRDLVTNRPCSAICESGYRAIAGELWFTRVLPPALTGETQNVVFTSPYVLMSPEGGLEPIPRSNSRE